jgi:hypothetical protein
MLAAVESQRATAIASARGAARDGRFGDALELIGQAEDLRRGPDVSHLKAALLLLAGDFGGALTAGMG